MWGHPVEQEAVRALCDRQGLSWIEDVSHAHFAEYRGRVVGSFGDIAVASLQGAKLISGGEGGIFLTNDPHLYERAVLLGHPLARSSELVGSGPLEPIGRTGYGLKLRCHPLAAVLIHDQVQHHADRWVLERRDSLTRLSNGLSGLRGLRTPVVRESTTSMGAWYGFKPWVDVVAIGITREQLVRALRAEGLDVEVPGSPPLHHLAIFDGERFPVAPRMAWQPHAAPAVQFPSADSYNGGTLSLPTPTGSEDEPILTVLVDGFQKVWRHLDALKTS